MDESKHGLIIDLNLYRPKRDLKRYIDAGVDGFIFRIGGPSRWYEGDYDYKEDVTWRDYMEQADKIGVPRDRIGGYIVHNPFEIWTTDYNVHIDLLNQWTGGGFMPGYLILDHEVGAVWRGGTKIPITPYNCVGSMTTVMTKMYKTFGRPVMLYTARWFMNGNGIKEHVTRLDNVNGGGEGKQWNMWYAWYLNVYNTKAYTNARDLITDAPNPTAENVDKYLQCGSHSLWDGWQITSSFKLEGDTVGVDASITRLPAEEYFKQMGAKPITQPEPPQPPPDDGQDDQSLDLRVDALENDMGILMDWARNLGYKG